MDINAFRGTSSTRMDVLALLHSVSERKTRSLLVTGEAGMGKSTLILGAAADLAAAGSLILRATPSFAERHTSYSMLWDLLSDLDWRTITGFPEQYRTILEVALGHRRSTAELPALATAIALEAILKSLSSSTPIVLVIDDLQWADPESCSVVERAFRRLTAENVSLISSRRDHERSSNSLPAITFSIEDVHHLGGLSIDELAELTRSAWPSTPTRAQVVALHEHTGGNPMWALELVERGDISNLGALPVGALRAPPSLAVAVADRLNALRSATIEVVSIVALLGRPTIALLTSVLRSSGIEVEGINEAEEAGFVIVTTLGASTRHPLQASAATARLTPARRRELHAIISKVIDDPVVRAQHLQQSQPLGPDEMIAQSLEHAGTIMRERGARLRSAHFDAQSVERTDPNSPLFQNRVINQAQQLFSAGDIAACLRVLEGVSSRRLDVHQYDAFLALMTSSLISARGAADAEQFLASQRMSVQQDLQQEAIITANTVGFTTLRSTLRASFSREVLSVLADVDTPNAVHRALRGLVRSDVEAGRGLDRALIADMDRRQQIQIVAGLDDTGLATTAFLAHLTDDVGASRDALTELAEWAKEEGKEGIERAFLGHGVLVELVAGNAAAARVLAAQTGGLLSSPVLSPELRMAAGLLLIADGRHAELAQTIARWEPLKGEGDGEDFEILTLRGLSSVAKQEWASAVVHLRKAAQLADSLEIVELGSRLRIDLFLVEGLFMHGELEEGSRRLASVRSFLATHDRPISQIGLYRMSSLEHAAAGNLTDATNAVSTAIECARAQQRLPDQILALLQRARLLTRSRRITLAQEDLDVARDLVVLSGITDLERQVEAAVSTGRKRRPSSKLTAAELRVLGVVREGHTNKEIAAQLFISVRTVESHIAAILRKTGASTRSKLMTTH